MMRGSLFNSVFKKLGTRRLLSTEAINSFKDVKIVEVKPFVYNVQLNREKKLNALNGTLWPEIGQAFNLLGKDPDCRVIILSGNGNAFCAGIDLNFLMQTQMDNADEDLDIARKCLRALPLIKEFQSWHMAIEKCQKPVIAAIHGACVGGATNMVAFADIRYCTNDAWFQVKEASIGIAADVGALQQLPKVIGNQSLARELCLTARKFDSKEAKDCGFVNRTFDDKESMMSTCLQMAESIAAMSPVAVQGTKINLNYSRDHSVQEGLDFIAHWNMSMLQSEDLMKAAVALISKDDEPPEFEKL